MPRPKATNPRDSAVSIRFTAEERVQLESAARQGGFPSLSSYFRHLHASGLGAEAPALPAPAAPTNTSAIEEFWKTDYGRILQGDSLSYLNKIADEKSVDLIMTSPPFGLVRKKRYGNEDADRYLDWFRPFAEGFVRVLKPNGSLVIDIGGSWIAGQPTRSLYQFKLLVMLVEEYGFHLCQEHYWWNPSKLPTPAEWVNVRRVRVKDAINTIWWLSPTPWPKANNRRVLAPYSSSMQDLFKNGYGARKRPSGHDISTKFGRDNGGSVPPNLLAIANTESNGPYSEYCRGADLEIHPARFPPQLPEYFIRLLTNPGDLVVDPFAGSCMTGAVAESLKRNWVCCELLEQYVAGALGRFAPDLIGQPSRRAASYQIPQPCSVPVDETLVRVDEAGGRRGP